MPGPQPQTTSASCTARITNASWKRNSGRSTRSTASINCSTGWAIHGWSRDPAMRTPIRRHRKHSKKHRRTSRSDPSPTPRPTRRGLVPGRSTFWSTGHHRSGVGTPRITTLCGQTNPIRLGLCLGGSLSRVGQDCRVDQPTPEHGCGQRLLRADGTRD